MNSTLRRTDEGSLRVELCAKTDLHYIRSYCRRASAADWRSAFIGHFGSQSFSFPNSKKWLIEDVRSVLSPGQSISAATDQHPMVGQSKQ